MKSQLTDVETEECDLCGSVALAHVYDVPGTARGLAVYICEPCGLVQSLPRIDHVPRNAAFPDSGAGFGNIRYGKAFRTEFAIEQLAKHIDFADIKTCLDVGANRGSFLLALLEKAPKVAATAVEPDERVLEAYGNHPQIKLVNERIENAALGEGQFDLIYHCHTLEHQARPVASLQAICRSLTDEGVMFLEVPNISFLEGGNIVEEWFIDKHLYHYSIETLSATLQMAGFDIVQAADPNDATNVTLIVKRGAGQDKPPLPSEFHSAQKLVVDYGKTLVNNQLKLAEGAARLSEFCQETKVAIWGAGRIYTSIVDVGGFDPTLLCAVVDKNLHKYVGEMFGVAVQQPQALADASPDVVLVASRLYFDEIKRELSSLLPKAKLLTLDDVLEGNVEVHYVT